jgi:cyclophilin family peptidyl-prolyl cis-trans isomerase
MCGVKEDRMLMRHCAMKCPGLLALALATLWLTGSALAQDAAKGAVITMQKGGEIRIEFFPADAPKTVENFVKLSGEGFYDGQLFHRVEPKFVVQTGDPQSKTLKPGDPKLGTGGPGYTIKAEFNKRPHERGVVAMARTSDPDSAGSQFYITLAPANFLDGKYTVFGKVVSGMEVVDSIKVGDRIASIKITK